MNLKTQVKLDAGLYILFHLAGLLVFFVPFRWQYLLLFVCYYFVRMFGITAGYHRYFSHKTFRTNRVFQFILALLGSLAMQKGPLWWASRHRHHHKYSDMPEDVHSPLQHGFFESHVGWIFRQESIHTDLSMVPDLAKYPELRFLDRIAMWPAAVVGVIFYYTMGWGGVIWGYVLSTIFLFHATYTINSLCHVFGSQRYDTGDTSRNNLWLALLTLGEGWHNNHHYYQHSVRQGFYWWEVDISFYILKVLSWFKLVTRLKMPPLEIKGGNRIQDMKKHLQETQEALKNMIESQQQKKLVKNPV